MSQSDCAAPHSRGGVCAVGGGIGETNGSLLAGEGSFRPVVKPGFGFSSNAEPARGWNSGMELEWNPKWKCSRFGWSGGFWTGRKIESPSRKPQSLSSSRQVKPASRRRSQAAAARQPLFPRVRCGAPQARKEARWQHRTINSVSVGVNKATLGPGALLRIRCQGVGMEHAMRCGAMQHHAGVGVVFWAGRLLVGCWSV